jgi:hypothetical protein
MNRKGKIMKKLFTVGIICAALVLGSGNAFSAGTYLVYDPEAVSGTTENHVVAAMTSLGYTFVTRSYLNPVTPADLTTAGYEALIVGWSVGGNYSGLTAVGTAGISGNAVITGHDADYHTWSYDTYGGNDAAKIVMKRMVDFAGAAAETGIVAFPEADATPFDYLPSSWLIGSVGSIGSNNVTGITPDGVASGFYNGLTTADLSNWNTSFHAYFTAWDGSKFKSFELGQYGGDYSKVITIGTTVTPLPTPEPSILILLGCGLLGLLGLGKRD